MKIMQEKDTAVTIGYFYKGKRTVTLSILSSKSDKIMATGAGNMILVDTELRERAQHLITTTTKPHPYAYIHDEAGYSYPLPNLITALGCPQLEQFDTFISANQFDPSGIDLNFVSEPEGCRSIYWRNSVIFEINGRQVL